ncbi:MAG: NAD-dependent epimerase/dehydratase family protein [Pseudobdellovibrionaceae bacterium]
MSVIVTGKNSFLGRALQAHEKTKGWTFLAHNEPLDVRRGDVIVNCAYHPDLTCQPYEASKDQDLRLASAFADRVSLYVMISTRAVYPNELLLDEETPLAPQGFYGEAKTETEKRLSDILPEGKLLILRCSNIFGNEYGRKTFTGMCTTRLKDEGQIVFGLSPQTCKDFLPVEEFCSRLADAVEARLTGIYNMGSGVATPCGKVAEALIRGYGKGELKVEDQTIRGKFSLDISKLSEALDLPQWHESDILEAFESVGRALNHYELN